MTTFRERLIISSAVTLIALVLPVNALAQIGNFRDFLRESEDSNCACVPRYRSKYALDQAVRRLAYQSQRFQWQLERELNRSPYDGTAREKRTNQLSLHFHQAAETLHSLYAVGRSVDNTNMEARNLIRLGRKLDDFLWQACVSPATLEAWDDINRELFSLATVYDFDAVDLVDAETQGAAALSPDLERHSADLSYSRIWRWPF